MAMARLESAHGFFTTCAVQTDPALRVAAGWQPINTAQLDVKASQGLRHAPPGSRPVATRPARKP